MAKKSNLAGKNGNKETQASARALLDSKNRLVAFSEGENGIREKEVMPIVIEHISPSIDDGLFAAKCVVKDPFYVAADIFKEGHDVLKAAIKYRSVEVSSWKYAPMLKGDNDRWQGYFVPDRNSRYIYSVQAWVDPVTTWIQFMLKKCPANTNVASDLAEGIYFLESMQEKARGVTFRSEKLLRCL